MMTIETVRERLVAARAWWRGSALGRVEVLLLGAFAISLFGCGAGFFFGRVCGALPLAAGFAFALAGAWAVSWRRVLAVVATVLALLGLTAWTFSYTGTDALTYHYPMQRLLADGWNPVFASSMERFRAVAGDGLSPWHTLFLPKLSALSGALMVAATGLFAADAFLGYLLVLMAWVCAYRFARLFWGCAGMAAGLFATSIACSTKITSFLAGQVDYSTYAAMMAAIFAYLAWRRTCLPGDLAAAWLCIGVTMLAKSTGMVCGAVLCAVALALDWRRAEMRWGLVVLAVFVAVVGASPLLTAWVRYGSPFYPSMTFDPATAPHDITSDFTGNADALSMGYVARVAYAWVSPTLAATVCGWLSGNPAFEPVFTVAGGVAGMGTAFRLMLLGAIVALALARFNGVTLLCVLLFVSANLAPLKYIGYERYFPQIWAIPLLAAFNLFYAPRVCLSRLGRLFTIARAVGLVGVGLFTALVVARTLAYQGRMFVFEHARQQRFAAMRQASPTWRLVGAEPSFTRRKRAQAAGITLSDSPTAPTFSMNAQFLMPVTATHPDDCAALDRRFPICDTPSQLLAFPWGEALRQLPRPLFRE